MIKSRTFNHLFFVYSSSVCEAHSVYLSSFLRSLFICLSSLHRLSFFIPSFFVHLPVRLAPSFVRLLFVFCSLFHYLLLWFTPFFVRSFFCLTFPLLHSLSFGEGWGEDILFVFPSSARRARTVFHISFL